MFIFVLLLSCLSCVSSLDYLLDLLVGRNPSSSRRVSSDEPLRADEITILIKRLTELPFADFIKTEAWYKLMQNRSVAEWDEKDWKKFRPIISYLPVDILKDVDFNNIKILEVFGRVELQYLQRSMVANILLNKWGTPIFNAEEKFMKMGNIFCGLPDRFLINLDEVIIRSLLTRRFFQHIKTCSPEKLIILSKKATNFRVLGPLRSWTADSIEYAGSLVAGFNGEEIKKLSATSFQGLKPEVINLMPLSTLTKMRTQQLRQLRKSALLAWRRQTKDLRPIHSEGKSARIPSGLVMVALLIGSALE